MKSQNGKFLTVNMIIVDTFKNNFRLRSEIHFQIGVKINKTNTVCSTQDRLDMALVKIT